jgi:polyferredoxin
MDKVGYERGLIRFTSQDGLDTGKTHFVRPRLFGYAGIVIVMVGLFGYGIGSREPLSVDVIRDRGVKMYRISGNNVHNVYTVKINNMDQTPHTYDVSVTGGHDFKVRGYRPMQIENGEVLTLPLRVSVPKKQLVETKTEVTIVVTAKDNAEITATQVASFIGPAKH